MILLLMSFPPTVTTSLDSTRHFSNMKHILLMCFIIKKNFFLMIVQLKPLSVLEISKGLPPCLRHLGVTTPQLFGIGESFHCRLSSG